jgi:hypothetical protein
VIAAGHAPLPSQVAETVATSAAQLASRHVTSLPARRAQLSRVTPSHESAEQALPGSAAGHAGCPVCGAPVIGVQVPRVPSASHASHEPVHATLQHTPSAQWPLAHWPSAAHFCPGIPFARQRPASHHAVAAQPLSSPQVSAHAPSLHAPGAHDVPVVSMRQVPRPSQV